MSDSENEEDEIPSTAKDCNATLPPALIHEIDIDCPGGVAPNATLESDDFDSGTMGEGTSHQGQGEKLRQESLERVEASIASDAYRMLGDNSENCARGCEDSEDVPSYRVDRSDREPSPVDGRGDSVSGVISWKRKQRDCNEENGSDGAAMETGGDKGELKKQRTEENWARVFENTFAFGSGEKKDAPPTHSWESDSEIDTSLGSCDAATKDPSSSQSHE